MLSILIYWKNIMQLYVPPLQSVMFLGGSLMMLPATFYSVEAERKGVTPSQVLHNNVIKAVPDPLTNWSFPVWICLRSRPPVWLHFLSDFRTFRQQDWSESVVLYGHCHIRNMWHYVWLPDIHPGQHTVHWFIIHSLV